MVLVQLNNFLAINQRGKHKYGIKLYTLAEPEGLVLKYLVSAGKNNLTQSPGHVNKIILQLMRQKLDFGHFLYSYFHNFYNDYTLASVLLAHNTYIMGTLQPNRNENPPDVISSDLK